MMKILSLGVFIFLLSACGWHLRGSTAGQTIGDSINLVIETTDNHSPFVTALRESLPNFQIKEISSSTDTLVLNLSKENLDRRTAGVGSDALTSAYEIILRVDYTLSKNGTFLTTKNNSSRLSRTYNYNVNNANSAEREEELVLREMRQELARTILRRVRSIAAKTEIPHPNPLPKGEGAN
jgi:LPS-assembly lipoprotein